MSVVKLLTSDQQVAFVKHLKDLIVGDRLVFLEEMDNLREFLFQERVEVEVRL